MSKDVIYIKPRSLPWLFTIVQEPVVIKDKRSRKLQQATPKWADRTAINAVYAQASKLNKGRNRRSNYGTRFVVDNIVPIQGKNVCGLHVHWNLQVITSAANHRKYNHHDSELVL